MFELKTFILYLAAQIGTDVSGDFAASKDKKFVYMSSCSRNYRIITVTIMLNYGYFVCVT